MKWWQIIDASVWKKPITNWLVIFTGYLTINVVGTWFQKIYCHWIPLVLPVIVRTAFNYKNINGNHFEVLNTQWLVYCYSFVQLATIKFNKNIPSFGWLYMINKLRKSFLIIGNHWRKQVHFIQILKTEAKFLGNVDELEFNLWKGLGLSLFVLRTYWHFLLVRLLAYLYSVSFPASLVLTERGKSLIRINNPILSLEYWNDLRFLKTGIIL